MKIVIIDERKGNVLRPEMEEALKDANIVGYVENDNSVRIELPAWHNTSDEPKGGPVIEFFEAVHRDVTSAEASQKANTEREAKRANVESEPALAKAARVWDDDHKGSSGTVKLGGS